MRRRERWLLSLYSPDFRRRHGAEWREVVERRDPSLHRDVALLWDTVKTAPRTRAAAARVWVVEHRRVVFVSLMVMPLVFLLGVLLEQVAERPGLLEWLYPPAAGDIRVALVDAMVVTPPFAAGALVMVSIVRFRRSPQTGRRAVALVGVTGFDLVVMAAVSSIGLLFVAYFLAENWACLFGGAPAC